MNPKDKDAYIEHLENTIKVLQNHISNLNEMLLKLTKEKYAPKSEKTPAAQTDGQISLFNEAEAVADPAEDEPIQRKGKAFVRRNKKTRRETILKDLPVKEVLCDVPETELFCENCGGKLKPIGKEIVREEIEYIPAKLQILRYVRLSYGCQKCKHTDKPYIIKALTPTPLMNHSLASPSSVAYVLHQKYVNSIPLYRQENIWKDMGIDLSRATMGNWIIRCAEDYFAPVVERLRSELVKRDVLHCDETPLQVLKEEGKSPGAKSYMWLYRTGNDGKPPVIIYDYQPSRSGDCAVEYLRDFKGFVHSDGYSGYNKLSGITRVGCWAHLRRKFVEAIPPKKAPGAALTPAEKARDYCDKLFHIESGLRDLPDQERKEKRLELEKPVIDEFWTWLEGVEFLKGSGLGKAVTYALNQKPYMENYLLDGRCELSNNAAENAIRPFTVGRKNWLFSDTPKGAKASAMAYTLVETAKANGLNVYAYLEQLLLYMPDTPWRSEPDSLNDLMPWSANMQETCK